MGLTYSIGGVLVGAQRWSITGCIGLTGPTVTPSAAQMGDLADDLFDRFVDSLWLRTGADGDIAARIGSRGNLAQVRTYYSDATGGPAEVVGLSTRAANPGLGTGDGIPQVAVVATLLTGLAGRRYRGRMYLPCTHLTLANGTFDATAAQAYATNVADFLSSFQTLSFAGYTCYPSVQSATGGFSTPITTVRVDNVLDTQRRRRDKVIATASPTAAIIAG